MESAFLVIAILIGFPIFFGALWCGILKFAAWVGGWTALARAYPHSGDFPPDRLGMQSASFGLSNYSAVLTVAADRDGLYMRPMVLFKFAHPPLFIPWVDIEAQEKSFIFTRYHFRFAGAPGVVMRTWTRLGAWIVRAGGL